VTAWKIKKMADNARPVSTGLRRYDKLNNAMQREALSLLEKAKPTKT
jgi:hypothetical protein